MPTIRRDLEVLGDNNTTRRLCPYCSAPFDGHEDIVRCAGCARRFTEYFAVLKWMAESAHWSLENKVSIISLTMLNNELDGLSANARIQLATTEIPVGAVTPIRLPPSVFTSISRVQHWPPVPPPLQPDGSRAESPVADIFDFWIVPEIESADVVSVVPVNNPKAVQSGRHAIQVQMTVHGVAFGTDLIFDRRLLGLSATRFFEDDYESSVVLGAVAAEAMLNRFAAVHQLAFTGRRPGLQDKFNSARGWCHRSGRTTTSAALNSLRSDFALYLAEPRNTFAHGEPLPSADLKFALNSLRTAVQVSASLECAVSETVVSRH
jgi:hypothetical protein